MDGQGESGGFSLTVDGRIAAAKMPVTPGLLCENRTQDREAPAGAAYPLGEPLGRAQCAFDGTAVKSAFALLLTKVTKPAGVAA